MASKKINFLSFNDIHEILEMVKWDDEHLPEPDIMDSHICIRDDKMVLGILDKARYPKPFGEPTIAESAAIYLMDFALYHPFTNGNKRTAFTATLLFLRCNGKDLKYKEMEAHDFVRYEIVARQEIKGEHVDLDDVASWIDVHMVNYREKPIACGK